jgi:hypothetical protein
VRTQVGRQQKNPAAAGFFESQHGSMMPSGCLILR